MQNYLYYNNLNLSLYYRILNKTPQNKSLIVIENSIIINDWGGGLGEGRNTLFCFLNKYY